jgi:hypothetical protein
MRSFHLARKLTILTAAVALFTAGCATNPYERFYTPIGAPRGMTANSSHPPEVLRGSDPEADTLAMLENGYLLIGYSSFRGRATDIQDAVAYGQKIGASAVVSYSRSSNAATASIPFVLAAARDKSSTPIPGSVNLTGATAGYSTQGSPDPVDRSDQAAGYFVKAGKSVLGVFARDLSPAERARLQSKRGLVAFAIMKESPASRGNLLRGDVLIEFAGEPVESQYQFSTLVLRHGGENVTVKVIRDESVREMQVQLNQPSPQARSRVAPGAGPFQEMQDFPTPARESHCHFASGPD